MMLTRQLLRVFFPVLMSATAPTQASIRTIEFSGHVTEVVDDTGVLAGKVAVGDRFVGSFLFDYAIEDSSSDPDYGRYESRAFSMHVNIGPYDLWSDQHHLVEIENREAWDGLSFAAYRFTSNDLWVSGMGAHLYDDSASVFSSDSLPHSLPPLSAFSSNNFGIEGWDFSIGGEIEAMVPEPCASLVWGVCVLVLTCRRTARRALRASIHLQQSGVKGVTVESLRG